MPSTESVRPPRGDPPAAADDSSLHLLERARGGDGSALNALVLRHAGPLRRWASGRLPQWLRAVVDTADLIQETFMRTFQRLDRFEPRHEGALQAYLRQAVTNRIRDEYRRARTQPTRAELDETMRDGGFSPLEHAIGQDVATRYTAALGRLRPEEQEAIVGRVELGYSYEQLALSLGKPSPGAARMAVARALTHLAREMGHEE